MDDAVKYKLNSYPKAVISELNELIATIYRVAAENKVGPLNQSLKWGQVSIASKMGSPIRLDWNTQAPDSISLYFNCNTKLVDTFKELFGGSLVFIGNRELVLPMNKHYPLHELESCLLMALRYHQIKNMPLLGN